MSNNDADRPQRSQRNVFDLEGKVALVTGGNSGIGRAMAESLLFAGADVCIWGRSADKNRTALDDLSTIGGKVTSSVVDVGQESQVLAAMSDLQAEHGRLDACFANAASHPSDDRLAFVDSDPDSWRRGTRTILDGAFFVLREAAKTMISQGAGGSLVATSSLAVDFGMPRGTKAYSAAKAGIVSLMRGLAVELGRYQIRANTILPAWVLSTFMDDIIDNPKASEQIKRRIPLRRWGLPRELGGIAVYLASDASTWHTGDEFRIDGGYSVF